MAERSKYVTPEQQLYAEMLEKGMYVGLLLLLLTFLLYATGIVDPYIPLDKIAEYWHQSSTDYLHKAGIPDGWGWVGFLGYGDFLNFIPIAILAAVTIFSYLTIIPILLRQNDKVYATLAGIEVLILILAASGLLKGGH
ncbi:MAG: hypothetical protein KGY38_00685 [Desulfobacterales bacterium]|nr:hypothetical protein [Desulfobacterales bacterium]